MGKIRVHHPDRKIFTLIDEEDYEWVSALPWRCIYGKKTPHLIAVRHSARGGKYLSRMLWELYHGAIPPGMVIDHVNQNSLDNRKANLRCCTIQQNTWNRRSGRSYGNCPYLGVTEVEGPRWSAQIRVEGKFKRLGYFQSAREAARAYDAAALAARGPEYTTLNFPLQRDK